MALSTDIISKLFDDIESKHDIKIIYAVEAGSRAWNLHSPTSDYDIRFVYVHKDKTKYSAFERDNNGTIIDIIDKLDYQGWDIIKTVNHLKESNSSIIEWLYTPIIYRDNYEFRNTCIKIVDKMHTTLSLLHHYVSMAKTNWKEWIEGKEVVIRKKYFHVIRPIVMVHWLLSFPDSTKLMIDVEETINILKSELDNETYNDIMKLILEKRNGEKFDMCEPIKSINKWVIEQFQRFSDFTMQKSDLKDKEINFKVQSLMSFHSKLQNECKKIRALSNKNEFIDRTDYLSIIGIGLQFIWLIQNPDKNSNEMPLNISSLLDIIDLSEDIRIIIKDIILIKDAEKKESVFDININDIKKDLLFPILNFYKLITDKSLDNSIAMDLIDDNTKVRLVRDDMVEYLLKHVVNVMYLLYNKKADMGRLKDVFSLKDQILPQDDLDKITHLIKSLKPKYLVKSNIILNTFFENIVELHKDKVEEMRNNIFRIREINTIKRLQGSIIKLDKSVFSDLYLKFVNI